MAVGAHISKHVKIPARDAVRVLDAISMLHDRANGRVAAAGPPSRDLQWGQHRDGRRPHGQASGGRRGAHHLPARPSAHAGIRLRGGRGAVGRCEDQVADQHQRGRGA